MKPVDQTTFGERGNCLSACLASILEIGIGDVPTFLGDGWWERCIEWCATRGFYPVYFDRKEGKYPVPAGYSLVGGPCMRDGKRSPRLHACVALDGEIVHDPNPCRAGLLEIEDYIVLVPIVAQLEAAK